MLRLGSMVARLKLKGIDGGSHKRWRMWFNSKQREEPYQVLTYRDYFGESQLIASNGVTGTGAAWLSSARAVRCQVKSFNERNPYVELPTGKAGNSRRAAAKAGGRRGRRQVIMAFMTWATHVLQWMVQREAKPRGHANP